ACTVARGTVPGGGGGGPGLRGRRRRPRGAAGKRPRPGPTFPATSRRGGSMSAREKLRSLLRIEHPLICAPMAGGPSTPALAAEVSRAGGLGFLGCAYSTPEQLLESSREVRARTDRPFGSNLFAEVPGAARVDPAPMLELLRPIHSELGLPPPEAPTPSPTMLDAQIDAVIESGAAVFSITFGLLSSAQLERLKRAGLVTMGTANTVEEARRIEAAGFGSVIAQGS